MNITETMAYIHRVSWTGSKLGLERTKELLDRLGNPEKNLKIVHVAGTNGKGSTAAMLASILREAGYRTGLYTSPYVSDFNERIQIDGVPISDADLASVTGGIRPHAEAMEEAPTEFELITAVGFTYFYQKACDIVVLEVGLGGELDSTNVIPTPLAAVITAIGLEHTKELGNTIAEIAAAKGGIIKEGGDVVIYGENPEAEAVFRKIAAERRATLHPADLAGCVLHRADFAGLIFDCGDWKDLRIPLIGQYQQKNAAVVLKTAEILQKKGFCIPKEAVYEGLRTVSWPGRLELMRKEPPFLVDGSHNPHGITATAETLRTLFADPRKKPVFLMGVMADKDVSHMIETLAPLGKAFVTVTPDNPRALPADELAKRLRAAGCPAEAAPDIRSGVLRAVELGEYGVCSLGSLYFAGEVRRVLTEGIRRFT
ncbi:MAG: bifunctional folylpolyglutamate synthase/dihydrofolate synthase [Lachnospiraceae bacterium]|nr:bifunctional folylpolyglutamate synthase/dihydrofolate synthase [Lachnospiraceae bacterium]